MKPLYYMLSSDKEFTTYTVCVVGWDIGFKYKYKKYSVMMKNTEGSKLRKLL